MKVSELIEKLSELKEKHGDLRVVLMNWETNSLDDVTDAFLEYQTDVEKQMAYRVIEIYQENPMLNNIIYWAAWVLMLLYIIFKSGGI